MKSLETNCLIGPTPELDTGSSVTIVETDYLSSEYQDKNNKTKKNSISQLQYATEINNQNDEGSRKTTYRKVVRNQFTKYQSSVQGPNSNFSMSI